MSSTSRQDMFIPCTVPVNAVFEDKERYPVICWRIEDISTDQYNKDMPAGYFVPVGMIIEQGSKYLVDASDLLGFVGYEYAEEE